EIDQLPVPYGAVATELGSGREVWLRHGKMLDAVRASCAMPGIFRPAERDGAVLVDGGLVNPVPVSMCRALGADIVIAVDLSWGKLGPYKDRGGSRGLEIPPQQQQQDASWLGRLLRRPRKDSDESRVPSIFEVFNTALDIVEQRVARSRLAGDPADVLITP